VLLLGGKRRMVQILQFIDKRMRCKIYKYLVFLALLLLFSCSKQHREVVGLLDECSEIAVKNITKGGDTVVVCDLSLVKESMIIPLSKLVDSLEIIRLESIDTAMVNPVNIDITDGYIGVNVYSAYKLFTRKGKYLTDIGRKGQGPGEYMYVYDSQIDEENKCIYLLPWASKNVFVYDLNGNLLYAIPLPYLVHKAVLNVDVKRQRISIVQLPFGEGDEPLAWTQNFEGQIIHENRSGYLDLWPDYSNEIPTQKIDKEGRYIDFYLYACVPKADSLYYYDTKTNKCIPKFTVNFPNSEIPRHVYYEFSNYYMVDIIRDNPYTWIIDNRILIDKSTLKGGKFKIVIDQLGGIPWEAQDVERGIDWSRFDYFVYCIEPGKLQIMIEEHLTHKDRIAPEVALKLIDFSNSISEDDNHYILLGKWK